MTELTYEQRISLALEAIGVPLDTVAKDTTRLEVLGTGAVLRWDGMAILNVDQLGILFAPEHTGQPDCCTACQTQHDTDHSIVDGKFAA